MSSGPSHVEVRAGAYADSVALLGVSRTVADLPGVAAAQVAMATPLNLEVLTAMGFAVPDAGPHDMVVALRLEPDADLAAALEGVADALAAASGPAGGGPDAARAPHRTTGAGLREVAQAARSAEEPVVALVSVQGPSAVVEAMDAVSTGHDVMVFSDNVPLVEEVALKQAAARAGVLVMGPDCGTAVLDGVGLGFANVVAPGPVGIVAASGTGCQQVLALLDAAGVGVSWAYGVGGRDLSAAVGGLATEEALRRLDADPAVERILLVSKPPDDAVAARVLAGVTTPVTTALLGPGHPDLTTAVETLLGELGVPVPAWPVAGTARPPRSDGGTGAGGAVRGLFVGGTLATEARVVVEAALGAGGGHTFLDLGDDEYTAGRAHPMIDPTLRTEHAARAAADPGTGVLLLDVVLGHGAEPDPVASLLPAIQDVEVPVVVALVGTAGDPQDRDRQCVALVAAGAEVHLSNAVAARRAAEIAAEVAVGRAGGSA